jgi:hypothetical protein
MRLGDLRAQWPDDPLGLAHRVAAAPPPPPGATATTLPWGPTVDRAPLLRELNAKQLSEAAHRIAGDPAAASRVLDEGLRQGIATADAFAQQGLALKAITKLDELIATHGPLPDLTLRKALALVQRNRNSTAAEAIAGSTPSRLRDPSSFLSEVEARMRQAAQPGGAEQIARLHDLVRWRERAGSAADATERLALSVHKGRLSLDLHTKRLKLEPTAADDLSRTGQGPTLIYVQDSPGLNNLDFNVSVQQALAGLPAGRLPRVMRAGNQTIAEFRPDKIYIGDPQVGYQLVNKPSATQALQGVRSGSSDRCSRTPDLPECRREAPPAVVAPPVPGAESLPEPARILIISLAS